MIWGSHHCYISTTTSTPVSRLTHTYKPCAMSHIQPALLPMYKNTLRVISVECRSVMWHNEGTYMGEPSSSTMYTWANTTYLVLHISTVVSSTHWNLSVLVELIVLHHHYEHLAEWATWLTWYSGWLPGYCLQCLAERAQHCCCCSGEWSSMCSWGGMEWVGRGGV